MAAAESRKTRAELEEARTTSTRDATRCVPSPRWGGEQRQVSQAHGARRTRPRARQGASQHRRFRRGDAAHGRRHHTPPVARSPPATALLLAAGSRRRGTLRSPLAPSPPPDPLAPVATAAAKTNQTATSRGGRGEPRVRREDGRADETGTPAGPFPASTRRTGGSGRWEMNCRFERTGGFRRRASLG